MSYSLDATPMSNFNTSRRGIFTLPILYIKFISCYISLANYCSIIDNICNNCMLVYNYYYALLVKIEKCQEK